MRDFRLEDINTPLKTPDVVLRISKMNKADDLNTLPEVLDELADIEDPEIRQRIAGNPNANIHTLLKLSANGTNVRKHPLFFNLTTKKFKNGNPLNHSWVHDDADPMLASRKMQHLLSFASNPETDLPLLRILANHPSEKVLSAILKNKNANSELLFSLAQHPSGYVRTIVARHPSASPLLLSKMAKNTQSLEKAPEKLTIANSKQCPEDALKLFGDDDHSWVRRCVGKHENSPQETLAKLAFDPSVFVRISVAKNKKTPSYILMRLTDDDEPSIRFALARSQNSTPKILEKLSRDENAKVRYLVALHPNTPSLILDRLANDTHPEIRKAVSKNKNASEQALEKIRSHQFTQF